MKLILLSTLYLILVFTSFAAPVSFKGKIYDIELVLYPKPIHINYCKIASDSTRPFWWGAYDAVKNYKEYDSYESWIKYFSREYIEEFELNESLFIRIKLQPQEGATIVPKRSALYGVLFRYDEREVFIVKMHDSIVDVFNGDLDSLEGASVTHIFEKEDGIWKKQTRMAIGETFNFPFNDINLINQLMSSGKAQLDEATGVVIPLVTEQLALTATKPHETK